MLISRVILFAKLKTSSFIRLLLRYKSKYKTVGVLPIRIVKSNVLSVAPSSERNRKLIKRRVNLYQRDTHVTENMPNSHLLVLKYVSLLIDFKNSK